VLGQVNEGKGKASVTEKGDDILEGRPSSTSHRSYVKASSVGNDGWKET